MPSLSFLIAALLIFFAFLPGAALAADSSLAIIDAGVEQSEDAPFVPSDYQFLPGDFVYFSFQIAGFSIKSNEAEDVRRISLAYVVSPQDSKGVPLTPPNSGTVQTDLNPEDKNWMPKRRVSFLLPSYIASGEFRIHVVVKDLLGKNETAKEFPFRVGGVTVRPSSITAVQNFRFLRQENDRVPLEVPAYRPGDTIYTSFEIVGFEVGPQNHYQIAYGVTVLRPNGKPFLEKPKAAEYENASFYPAQFIPGTFALTTSADTPKGEYVIILTVRDLTSNQSCQTKEAFSIE
jgi:hypothetical protein